jgi:hypothetical protein
MAIHKKGRQLSSYGELFDVNHIKKVTDDNKLGSY